MARIAIRAELHHGGYVAHPALATILDLIARQAEANPSRAALLFGDSSLAYGEMMDRSNAVARELQSRGVRPGQCVALAIGNSLSLPMAMLGAMRSGAVFVPVDPSWSTETMSRRVGQMRARAVLVEPGSSLSATVPIVEVTTTGPVPDTPCAPVQLSGADPAYTFYTSGSSGSPKLTVNLHRGLLNRFLYMTRRFSGSNADVVLQNSRPLFDSSLWQVLWPLTMGARVVIPDRRSALDFDLTLALLARHRVTMTDFVPSIFNAFVDHLQADARRIDGVGSLRHLLVGGEEMNGRQVQRFKRLAPDVTVTNTYGPTEASIGMIFHEVKAADGDVIPLGRPISNTFALVLRPNQEVASPDEVGELYIGGDCLGHGYLGDEATTQATFVANPFPQLPGPRLYRTGDRVYQDLEGIFHWVGRVDGQVKVNGVRLDVGDVERALLRHPGVAQAAVIVENSERMGSRLTACIAAREGTSIHDIRAHVKQLLPRDAVPHRIVCLDDLPLTGNGKIDRIALAAEIGRVPPAPMTPRPSDSVTAENLAALFAASLEVPDYDVDDDFFAAGGDSLLALVLVSLLETAFERRLSFRDLYERPTPSQLLEVLLTLPTDTTAAPRPPRGSDHAATASRTEQDIHLTDDVVFADPAPGEMRNVLVTGATGFLGAHIAATLLDDSQASVLCLVRADTADGAGRRLRETWGRYGVWDAACSDRIVALPGDLRDPRLGMDDRTYGSLCESVDTVVHCGAVVDFLHGYAYHRATNVCGTAHIVRFCAEAQTKVLHHLSTLSVVPSKPSGADVEAVGEGCDVRTSAGLQGGYEVSKWVSERLIERSRARGLPVSVYRLGEVMPHSRSGVPNDSSAFVQFARTVVHLGAYPRLAGRTDYVPVDWVAQILVANASARTTSPAPLHLFHPEGLSLADLGGALSSDEHPIRAIDVREWAARLTFACDDAWAPAAVRSFRALLDGIRPAGETGEQAEARLRALLLGPLRRFSQADAVRVLPGGWPPLPSVTEELLRPFVERLTTAAPIRPVT